MLHVVVMALMVLAGPEEVPALHPPTASEMEARQRLTGVVAEAVASPEIRVRDRILGGLRRLRDPSLRALFSRLSTAEDPALRVNGLLGLAELEPRRGVDLLAVSKIPDQRLQGMVIVEALDSGLVPESALTELSGWGSLHPSVRVLIAGRCVRIGRAFDRPSMEALCREGDALTAVTAALLLRRSSLEPTLVARTLATREAELAVGPREPIAALASFVMLNRLEGAGESLRRIETLRGSRMDAGLRDDLLSALLGASPMDEDVRRRVVLRLGAATPTGERVSLSSRLLDVGLELGTDVPAWVPGLMAGDGDALVRAMGGALEAVRRGPGGDGAAIAGLVSRGHGPSVRWALRAAEQRPWNDARSVRLALLSHAGKERGGWSAEPGAMSLVADAVTKLVDDDPRSLDRPLAEAVSRGDGVLVGSMLTGVLRSTHGEAGALVRQGAFEARPDGPWPDGACAALARLVAIRHGEETADPGERVQRLTEIATGVTAGGPLDETLRVQAAWLALRATGQDRIALTRILSELPIKPADK